MLLANRIALYPELLFNPGTFRIGVRSVSSAMDTHRLSLSGMVKPLPPKLSTSSYPHQFYKRKLYKANPQSTVSGGQLAVYSRGALQRKLHKAKPQSTVSEGQLAVYSRGGFAEEGRQRKRRRTEKEEKEERRTGQQ